MYEGRSPVQRAALPRWFELLVLDLDGRLLLLAFVGLYLVALAVVGGDVFWRRLGVPHMSPSFADMRSITSGWECTRKGIPVVPADPCDPWNRPVNYPQLWLAPSFLGIGQGATVYLGVSAGVTFFASLWALVGRLRPLDGLIYAAAVCSPAVMLGIERGNNDLIVFSLIVLALVLFRRGSVGRAVAHGLFLLAGMLKLYPAFSWGVLVRQRRSWAFAGIVALGASFAAYMLATWSYERAIERASPQSNSDSYGARVLADLQGPGVIPASLREFVFVALGAVLAAVLVWRARVPAETRAERGGDAFCAGAGIYCGSYLIFKSFDYRLMFLLLVLPQLLRWTRSLHPSLPFPRVAVAVLLGALWLGTTLPVLPAPLDRLWTTPRPLDEYLNWLLFVYLAAGLVLNLAGARRSEAARERVRVMTAHGNP